MDRYNENPSQTSVAASAISQHELIFHREKEPPPPPDGGLRAWMVVLATHLTVMNSWGIIASFGVFQTYYGTILDETRSSISWIGSMQVFLLFFVGVFGGRATDAGYFRLVYTLGAALQVLSMFMTSLCSEYWQFFLAQGVCSGLANGMMFCAGLSVMSTYFRQWRGVAVGFATTGSVTGGVIYPLMAQHLIPSIGFPWTMRCMGFVCLATLLMASALYKTRIPPRITGPLIEWGAFRELSYNLFLIASFLMFCGIYFAFYYAGSYALSIGLDSTTSFNSLIIMNAVGLIGRLLPTFLADRYFGVLNIFAPVTICTGIIIVTWMTVETYKGMLVFVLVYGVFAAGVQALFPAAVAALTDDPAKAGTRIGMSFTVVSFGCVVGPPICGALIEAVDGDYVWAQTFCGVVLIAGGVLLGAARVAKTGFVLRAKN
ncbi:uncharacterized protein LAJ45_11490 [Morchella importuna]|uniref:uncharacterized protein n=1 Tax=Morchella importuna TaxID=1174673 RepID=UPI001E8E80B6|nr:uncharacterized protein LAJ45_11490 [Morchella importuna]KAH8144515.1 hypothetical protein LAJ45_11490 [Morchella importuna]